MKNIKCLLACFAVLGIFSITNVAAENPAGKNSFEITLKDDLYVGNRAEKAWAIKYENSKAPVTVVRHKTTEGVFYSVHSEFFDVCYLCSEKGFGAAKIRKQWCTVDPEICRAVINSDEMARQKVLTPRQIDDDAAVGLIASYLPMLLNPAYQHLLN
jgi:hypothetical protein